MRNLRNIVATAQVIVCVGRGGVGKTTMSAAIAREAAGAGRRALVLTIDPARRLADALGVAALGDEPVRLPDPDLAGEMWAAMLRTDEAFETILRNRLPDPVERASLESNRFYRFFATSLAGAHELAASERLHDLANSGRFDLVVLDTPPALHAADFLDAPRRFHEALDSSAFAWLTGGRSGHGRRGLRIGVGVGLVQKTLSRFTGAEFLAELTEFLSRMASLMEGIKERAAETSALIRSERAHFILVVTPTADAEAAVSEAAEGLRHRGCRLSALIVNRLMPEVTLPASAGPLTRLLEDSGLPEAEAAGLAGRLCAAAAKAADLAKADEVQLREVVLRWGEQVPVVPVRAYPFEVASLASLDTIRAVLVSERDR